MLYYIFFQIDINALICISWLPFYCILSILCKHSLHRHFLAAICKLHATLVRTSYVFSLNQTVFDAMIIKTRIFWWWTPWKLVTSRHQRLSGILMKSLPHLSFSYCYFVSPRIKTQLVASLQFPILDFPSNHVAGEFSKGNNCNITLFYFTWMQ